MEGRERQDRQWDVAGGVFVGLWLFAISFAVVGGCAFVLIRHFATVHG